MMEIWLQRIGEIMKTARSRENEGQLTQDSLATAANISRGMVNIIENPHGTRGYGIDQLLKYIAGLHGEYHQTDPVRELLSGIASINNLSAEEMRAARKIIEALNDPDRRTAARSCLKMLEDMKKPASQLQKDGTGDGP